MVTTVKAIYANGVLAPSEPLDIEEGTEVTLSIEAEPATGGGLAAIARRARELHEATPPDARDELPADLARNKKHYLYGHPKEGDA